MMKKFPALQMILFLIFKNLNSIDANLTFMVRSLSYEPFRDEKSFRCVYAKMLLRNDLNTV